MFQPETESHRRLSLKDVYPFPSLMPMHHVRALPAICVAPSALRCTLFLAMLCWMIGAGRCSGSETINADVVVPTPAPITLPQNETDWVKLKGKEFAINLHDSETQTRITLPARVRVAIIPNPADRWACTWDVTDPAAVDWRGDMTQPEGLTKQLQIKAYTMGGAQNGPVQVDKDKSKATWINVADLPNMTWTGPGMIRFRGQLRGAPGYGKGVIRVKIVPLAGP